MARQLADSYALTVRAPWAQSILLLGKDVENRTWRTHYRGTLYVHVGSRAPTRAMLSALETVIGARMFETVQRHPLWERRSAIIGSVELLDCIEDSRSRWALPGAWHWILTNPKRLRPIPQLGGCGLWPFEP